MAYQGNGGSTRALLLPTAALKEESAGEADGPSESEFGRVGIHHRGFVESCS
jgi:hypothetical protein